MTGDPPRQWVVHIERVSVSIRLRSTIGSTGTRVEGEVVGERAAGELSVIRDGRAMEDGVSRSVRCPKGRIGMRVDR